MRQIERTSRFKKDFKREIRGRNAGVLEKELRRVLAKLVVDEPLDIKYRDHQLTGTWSEFRDCHLKPDLLLIYRKTPDSRLQLVRLGSHSELGL